MGDQIRFFCAFQPNWCTYTPEMVIGVERRGRWRDGGPNFVFQRISTKFGWWGGWVGGGGIGGCEIGLGLFFRHAH